MAALTFSSRWTFQQDFYSVQAPTRLGVFQALENLKTSQTALKVAGVGMLIALASVIGQGEQLLSFTPLALLSSSAGTFWFSQLLHSFEAKFIFQEYNHGKR